MKTIQLVCLSLLTGFVLLTSCKKDEMEIAPASSQQNAGIKTDLQTPPVSTYANWREDFATANSLALRWNLYGTPQPQWVYFACKRFGLFDNNGRLPNGSFAVSKAKIGNGNGYSIESDVFINVLNPAGTTICPGIGVTRSLSLPTDATTVKAGISMELLYIGTGAESVPAKYQNHTYVIMTALLPDGSIISSADPNEGTTTLHGDYAFPADVADNGWHKLKIVVTASKQVSFYLDNQFIWSPGRSIHPSLMKNQNVFLGITSPGSAGKAYHDYVKVTYPIIGAQATVDDPAPTE